MYVAIVLSTVLFRVLAVPSPEGAPSTARAINNEGVAAGEIGNSAFTWNGAKIVLYKAEPVIQLDGPWATVANALNDEGSAVGNDGTYLPVVMSGNELATAVQYHAGTVSYLDRTQNASFEANGINNAGIIVGERMFRGFVQRADGTMIEIHPLSTRDEWNGTRASAINNENDIVGGTTVNVRWPLPSITPLEMSERLPIHAFLLHLRGATQQMTDLGALPGFQDSYATAVADDGTIVGYSGTSSGAKWTTMSGASHAWMWYHGRMSDLGTLRPPDVSAAFAVNDRGVVVGCSGATERRWTPDNAFPYSGQEHLRAVRWVNKRIEDLNALISPRAGWRLLCARGINREGWIVGDGLHNGKPTGFVLEPNT